MKILILAITRGRPLELCATILSLRRLESRRNEIEYLIRYDDDDEGTDEIVGWLKIDGHPITGVQGQRPTTLGAAINAAVPPAPWDILQVIPDDIQPLSPEWDHHLALASSRAQAGSWQELADPMNPTLPFITRHWYDRVGRAGPEWFPFWFADTWQAEVFAFAYDRPMPIIPTLPWWGRRGKTTNMRDLAFWVEVWAATRPERLAEAGRLTTSPALHRTEGFERNDQWLRENCLRLQASLGDERPSPPGYTEAKERAATLL